MPRCAEPNCGRWRPGRLAPGWTVGVRLNGDWYCSKACVEAAARDGLDARAVPAGTATALPPLKIGVLLRHQGALSAAQLDAGLEAQRRTRLRLGAQLQALGFATGEQVLMALAAQANVSYLTSFDLDRVRRGAGPLPAATARALGLVPFEADAASRRMRVICSAPVPRTALRALAKLSGWTAEPYLVEDATYTAALEAYRPAQADGSRVEAMTLDNVDAAAAQVAEAAAMSGAVTMRHANCDDYMWVRVEGPQRVSDLLVTDTWQEDEWQAERTAH